MEIKGEQNYKTTTIEQLITTLLEYSKQRINLEYYVDHYLTLDSILTIIINVLTIEVNFETLLYD